MFKIIQARSHLFSPMKQNRIVFIPVFPHGPVRVFDSLGVNRKCDSSIPPKLKDLNKMRLQTTSLNCSWNSGKFLTNLEYNIYAFVGGVGLQISQDY